MYGHSNSAGTKLYLFLPLAKPLSASATVALTSGTNEFYIRNGTGVEIVAASKISSFDAVTDNVSGLYFGINLSSAISSPHNAILSVAVNLTFTMQ